MWKDTPREPGIARGITRVPHPQLYRTTARTTNVDDEPRSLDLNDQLRTPSFTFDRIEKLSRANGVAEKSRTAPTRSLADEKKYRQIIRPA
jgi:hypothetical protein